MSCNGLIRRIPSVHSAKETIDLIEAEVKSKGMAIFARVDHAVGAHEVGLKLTFHGEQVRVALPPAHRAAVRLARASHWIKRGRLSLQADRCRSPCGASVVLTLYPLSEPRDERRAEFHPRSAPVAVLSC